MLALDYPRNVSVSTFVTSRIIENSRAWRVRSVSLSPDRSAGAGSSRLPWANNACSIGLRVVVLFAVDAVRHKSANRNAQGRNAYELCLDLARGDILKAYARSGVLRRYPTTGAVCGSGYVRYRSAGRHPAAILFSPSRVNGLMTGDFSTVARRFPPAAEHPMGNHPALGKVECGAAGETEDPELTV